MSASTAEAPGVIRSPIPARIDRLPWSPLFTRMGCVLGVAWSFGRRENTFVAAVIPTLTDQATPGLSSGAARCRASALTARTQTLAWSVISCFAAAGYRTVSEIFPTREPIRGGLSRWPGCPPYRNQSVVKASRE